MLKFLIKLVFVYVPLFLSSVAYLSPPVPSSTFVALPTSLLPTPTTHAVFWTPPLSAEALTVSHTLLVQGGLDSLGIVFFFLLL